MIFVFGFSANHSCGHTGPHAARRTVVKNYAVATYDNVVTDIDASNDSGAGSDIDIIAYYGESGVAGFTSDGHSLANHAILSNHGIAMDNDADSMVGKPGVFADGALRRHDAIKQHIIKSVNHLGDDRDFMSV